MWRWVLWFTLGLVLLWTPSSLGWVDGKQTNTLELVLAFAFLVWVLLTVVAVPVRLILWLLYGWRSAAERR